MITKQIQTKPFTRKILLLLLLSMGMAFTTCYSHATEWGSWSEWQDAQVTGSSTRQVETRQVIDSYNMETWVYTDQSSPNLRGYWPNSTDNTLRAHYTETWPKPLVDNPWRVINANTFYDSPDNDNCDGQIHDAKAYVVVDGQGHSYVPFFIKGTNYKTQYRYRDQIIENADISSADIKSKTDQDSDTIASNGKSVEDNITVSMNGTVLVKNRDYTVSYDNTVTVGIVKVTVSGIGNYFGTCSKSFTLLPPKTDVKTVTVDNNQIIIYWDKNDNATGYEVQVSRNSNFEGCTSFTIEKNTTTEYTVSHLAETGTYYVRVRSCYRQGKTDCYSDWSPVKTVYVAVKEGSSYDLSLAKVNPIPDKTYTGKTIKPNPTIVNGTYTLRKGVDYTVKYKNNKKIGTATVTMTGKGKYYNSAVATFKIVPKGTSFGSFTIADEEVSVRWKKQSNKTSGYQVQYSEDPNFTDSKTLIINKNSTTSTILGSLVPESQYYIRIRTYASKKGFTYYSKWSSTKSFQTKSEKISILVPSKIRLISYDHQIGEYEEPLDITGTYSYNAKGLIESVYIESNNTDDPDLPWSNQYRYTYHENGAISTIEYEDSYDDGEGVEYYKYCLNKHGAVTKADYTWQHEGGYSGGFIGSYEVKYYGGTHLVNQITEVIKHKGESGKNKTIFKFDKGGRCIYYSDYKIKKTFDPNGLVLSQNGSLWGKYSFEYEYDGDQISKRRQYSYYNKKKELNEELRILGWKKITIDRSALRSVRLMSGIVFTPWEEEDYDYQTFAYDWEH